MANYVLASFSPSLCLYSDTLHVRCLIYEVLVDGNFKFVSLILNYHVAHLLYGHLSLLT